MLIVVNQLVSRLDNSAVSTTGAELEYKSNQNMDLEVATVPQLDVVMSRDGSTMSLSRRKSEAPYLIYEEDERLLQESNTTTEQISGSSLVVWAITIVPGMVQMLTAQRISS